ncbi:MAG TPA: hypothetical protein VGD79_09490 [Thermoanaerobaculia bacterium]|jgi:uncharacterized protein (DUF983 family)
MRPSTSTVLMRGIRGKCPRCGEGDMFAKWVKTKLRCDVCDLLFQRNYGDIWMFTNIMDRLPIFIGVAALFFGFRVESLWSGALFLAAMVVPMAATVKQRQGVALALDYLWRVRINDPSDRVSA